LKIITGDPTSKINLINYYKKWLKLNNQPGHNTSPDNMLLPTIYSILLCPTISPTPLPKIHKIHILIWAEPEQINPNLDPEEI
jgi:hypothetical protein